MALFALSIATVSLQFVGALATVAAVFILSLVVPRGIADTGLALVVGIAMIGAWLPAFLLARSAAHRYPTLQELRPLWVATASVVAMATMAIVLIRSTPPQRVAVGRMLSLQVSLLPVASAVGVLLGGLVRRRA